jgi:hypothetical protein
MSANKIRERLQRQLDAVNVEIKRLGDAISEGDEARKNTVIADVVARYNTPEMLEKIGSAAAVFWNHGKDGIKPIDVHYRCMDGQGVLLGIDWGDADDGSYIDSIEAPAPSDEAWKVSRVAMHRKQRAYYEIKSQLEYAMRTGVVERILEALSQETSDASR